MGKTFITRIHIDKVRHLADFDIPLSKTEMKHLIITGKNGSGKTSVIEHVKDTILRYTSVISFELGLLDKSLLLKDFNDYTFNEFREKNDQIIKDLSDANGIYYNQPPKEKSLLAYFPVKRAMPMVTPKGIKQLPSKEYTPDEDVSSIFMQQIANSVFDQLLAEKNQDKEKAASISYWLKEIESQIKSFLEGEDVTINFDGTSYSYVIQEKGKAAYNMSQLPDGFNAYLSILAGIMLRLAHNGIKNYEAEGIVLIDEVDAHLHVSLQKKIMGTLTKFFPNIQFIVTTHSPFVISSLANAVVCDLEKRIVTQDLTGYSYGTLVESYFGNDNYSDVIKKELAEYEALMKATELSLDQEERLQDLETKLNQLPKYWAPELQFKLNQIQLEIADRDQP